MVYVTIKKINGRYELYKMINEFGDRYEHVEYYPGDNLTDTDMVLPHLKFAYEDDAIVYCLIHGKEYSTYIPTQHKPG